MEPSPRYVVLRAEDVEPFTHPGDPAYHSRHILGAETTGRHDLLLNHGTLDARRGLGGTNHPDNDEIYYVVRGTSLVDLGGDADTGEGGETYRITAGMVVFIAAGVFHRLRNDSADDLVILAIWPQPAAPGANGVHDERLATWGTGFRLRSGCSLLGADGALRVAEPAASWDPLVIGS
jgi:mannose-6-phosphate isomerase-like protein (cupin superfamily)